MFEELRIGQNSLGKQWRDDNEELGRWVEIYNLQPLLRIFFQYLLSIIESHCLVKSRNNRIRFMSLKHPYGFCVKWVVDC